MSLSAFAERFGGTPDVAADAPGRVNLIGEHTDTSGGFVLPAAIPRRCRVELARRPGRRVRLVSANREEDGVREYALGGERQGQGWIDFVQGITRILAGRGDAIGGFDAAVSSDVPLGSGLASSAALEVSMLRALRDAFGLGLDDVALAQVGRSAENEFVGAPVGIMDQMVSSLAPEGAALFLDTRSLAHETVSLPPGAELGVIDSGLPHEHAKGGYRTRRAEVDEAARCLGVRELRDLYGEDPDAVAARLPEPLARRARHVLTENRRVLDAVEALRANDLTRMGSLMRASHRSLAEDFEVSTPEIDLLVSLADERPGVYGARITGGGFGGSVLLLAARGTAREAADAVAAAYRERMGRAATVLLPIGDAGAIRR
jgi:galactokinase